MRATTLLIAITLFAALSGAQTNQDTIMRIQRVLDVHTAVTPEDEEFIRAHPTDAKTALEPGLQSKDLRVRIRSAIILMSIPGHESENIVRCLKAKDHHVKELAIKKGVVVYPHIRVVAAAFINELVHATDVNQQLQLLNAAHDLEPDSLPAEQKESLRLILEGVAHSVRESLLQNPIILLGKYRDADSCAVLQALAKDVAGGAEQGIDYTKLPLYFNVALAMNEDAGAVAHLAEIVSDSAQSVQDRYLVLNLWWKYLVDKKPIQLALIKLLPETKELRQLENKVRNQAEIGDETAETIQVKTIYRAAYLLATALGIPPTQSGSGPMTPDDVAEIKSAAATRLGLAPENPPDR